MNKQTKEPIRVGMQLDCKVLVNIYQKRLFVGTHFLVCSLSRNDSYALNRTVFVHPFFKLLFYVRNVLMLLK